MQVNNHLMNGQIFNVFRTIVVGMLITKVIIYKKNFIQPPMYVYRVKSRLFSSHVLNRYTWQRSDKYSKYLMEKDVYDRDQPYTSSRDAEVSKEMTGYHSDYNAGDIPLLC